MVGIVMAVVILYHFLLGTSKILGLVNLHLDVVRGLACSNDPKG
jgi:hypothetical protein